MPEQGLSNTRAHVPFDHSDYSLPGKMELFVRMVRTGSITAAAEQMNMSVSTGSRWLSDLEHQLGAKLHCRRGGGFTLTSAGRCLFERFGPISDNIRTLIHDMERFVDEPQGMVRICCTPIFAQNVLLPIINAFNRDYRKVRFSLDINPYGLDQHGRYDLVINAQASYQPLDSRDLPLVKRNLLREPFVLIASPDYLEGRDVPRLPGDLQEHTCLYADSLTHSRQWAFEVDGQVRLVGIPDNLEVSDTNLLFDAAKMGMGIGYLPRYVVEQSLRSGQLVQLLPEYKTADWVLNLYYPELKQLDHSCQLFKDFFISTFEQQLADDRPWVS